MNLFSLKTLKRILYFSLLLAIFLSPLFILAQDPLEERTALEEELKQLEEQISQYEQDISKTRFISSASRLKNSTFRFPKAIL